MTRPRLAVIGAGYWGKNIIRAIKTYEIADIECVHDIDMQRLKEISSLYSSVKLCFEIDQILRVKNIDGVIIAVNIDKLYNVSKIVLENGFNVFIEKPVAESLDKVSELKSLAESKNIIAVPGFILRFDPVAKFFKRLITQENLHPLYIMMQRSGRRAPRYRGNSIILDLGIHDIDLLNYLFNRNVRVIDALITRLGDDESYNIYLDCGNCVAHLTADPIPNIKIRRIYVNFEEEVSYEGDFVSSEIHKIDSKGVKEIFSVREEIEPLGLELKAFVDKISGKDVETPSLEDAVYAHMIIKEIFFRSRR
ncbi:MAG: Gfo/Idh/MocA family oxidoreductase [Sulfolobales archaeon]